MVLLLFRLLPGTPRAFAQQLPVNIGTPLSWGELTGNIVNFLAASIGFLAVAMFIFGALKMTASAAKEDWRTQGKDLMIHSLVAMAIVLGAYAILRTVTYVLLP